MNIVITSDHAAFELKQKIVAYFSSRQINIVDLGPFDLNKVDYPDYAFLIGKEINTKKYDFGIALCGTGIGMSIACNKVKGIRAALIYSTTTARLAKEHNNANIICLGARVTSYRKAIKLINTFSSSTFEPRHQKRLDKMSNYEKEC